MESLYKTIFEKLALGGIVLERKGPETFIILDVNPAAAQVGNWQQITSEDIIGMNILDVFEGIRESGLLARYHQALDTGEVVRQGPFAYEDPEVPSGIFDVNLLPLSENHLLISYLNITQQKQSDAARDASECFLKYTLDALSTHIAVLDGSGTIIATNAAWRHFADTNGLALADYGVGTNYLMVCDAAEGPGGEEAHAVAQGIRAILADRQDTFHIEYPCHSPEEQRWFNVRVTRFEEEGVNRVVVAHENITERKQAEEQLQQSEERYRSVFIAMAEGVSLYDADATLLVHNASAERILGLTADQMAGRSLIDSRWHTIYEDGSPYPAEEYPAMVTLREGTPLRNQIMGVYKPDDTLTWISINTEPLFQEGEASPSGVVASFVDISEGRQAEIALKMSHEGLEQRVVERTAELTRANALLEQEITERKQAEEALRESETLWRSLVENVGLLVVGLDLHGNIDYVNPHFARVTGFDREEALGKHWFSHFLPEAQRREIQDAFLETLEDDFHEQYQNAIITKTGEERVIAWSNARTHNREGRIIGTFSIGVDITERQQVEEALRRSQEELEGLVEERTAALSHTNTLLKQEVDERRQAEEALRESEERLRTVMERMPEGVSVVTTDKILYVNPTILSMMSYTREEVFGKTPTDFIHPEDRERVGARIGDLFVGGDEYASEYRMLTRYERIVPVEVVSRRIYYDGAYAILSVFRDLTERKQAEAERERLITELEAKNTELERFTHTVSHDLKSPLFTIKGFLGLLEKDIAAGNIERVHTEIEQITTAADKMQHLLDELLELSRVGRLANPSEEIALVTLAQEAVDLVGGRVAERGVAVEIDPALPVVIGDRVRLSQVFQNLVGNAVKFMGDQPEPRVEIGVRKADAMPVIYVRDNGMGIEPRYHEKVFSLFERLDRETEGTGFGLSLVKRIVEVHGGRIWVESEGLGRGSTFFFTLPQQA